VCGRSFFQLGQHVDPEAYAPQMAVQKNNSTHRRRWYRVQRAVAEFSVHTEASIILEILLSGETARVLSTWDLQCVKTFLEVALG